MKKFLFRLETVLKVRKAKEGRMERELSFSLQKLSHWLEKEAVAEKQIASLMEALRKKREEKDRSLEETYQQILEHLSDNLKQVKNTIVAQQTQIKMQEERLKQAVQERKIVEKIKEKHYASWQVQTEQSDGALSDELALHTRFD